MRAIADGPQPHPVPPAGEVGGWSGRPSDGGTLQMAKPQQAMARLAWRSADERRTSRRLAVAVRPNEAAQTLACEA